MTVGKKERTQWGEVEEARFPYIYRWNRCGRKGERCRVTARGTLNSARVEFADGFVMVTSRNALRRARADEAH